MVTEPYDSNLLWIVIVGFIVAFLLACGIGANDVANSFGTSVGAGVLTIIQACILATVFEIGGAILIGYKVSDTMRKGILDVSLYEGHEKELMFGALSSLTGSAIWLMLATALKMPISATHSIVGAIVGFSLVCRGTIGVRWMPLVHIAGSWFASPMLSGLVSACIFWIIKKTVLQSTEPLEKGLKMLPLAYSITIATNVLSVALDGPRLLKLDKVPWWGSLCAALGIGILSAVIVYIFLVPWHRKRIAVNHRDINNEGTRDDQMDVQQKEMTALSVITQCPLPQQTLCLDETPASNKVLKELDKGQLRGNNSASPLLTAATGGDTDAAANRNLDEIAILNMHDPDVSKLFTFLQVMTAAFASFAHGGNDVSNAIGPLITLWAIYADGSSKQETETPILILLYGGIGISIGLWAWGRRVIETLGQDLVKITPVTGFTIEVGAALTVLLASKAGLPISTTHCKVGSVVCVGWASLGERGVSWCVFRNIAFTWLVTVPFAGLLSAGCMFVFRHVFDV